MKPEIVERVNCDDIMDNLTGRVCANLAFQESDAELNEQLILYLDQYESDSLRQEAIRYHDTWIQHRRRASGRAADGFRGHMLGLRYLGTMRRLTELRTKELRYLNGEEE